VRVVESAYFEPLFAFSAGGRILAEEVCVVLRDETLVAGHLIIRDGGLSLDQPFVVLGQAGNEVELCVRKSTKHFAVV
jgi:hypothetical protein